MIYALCIHMFQFLVCLDFLKHKNIKKHKILKKSTKNRKHRIACERIIKYHNNIKIEFCIEFIVEHKIG